MFPFRLRTPLVVVLVYGVLVIPWSGWDATYGTFFRVLGRTFFASKDGARELTFTAGVEGADAWHRATLTRIAIVNRALMQPQGAGPVRNLDFSTRGCWKAIALTIALVLAIPLPWTRRVGALFAAVLLMQGLVFLTLGFALWNEGHFVSLVEFSPFTLKMVDAVQTAMVTQLDVAMPVLVWIVVLFSSNDGQTWLKQAGQLAQERMPRLSLSGA